MAALCAAARLTRRFYGFRVSFATTRCAATGSKVLAVDEPNINEDGEKPTKRDPLAVLKALAGTVQPTALAPPRELFEDACLYPKSPRKREECKAARMSGMKAADFILHKYPQLFPMRKAEPGWLDMNQAGAIETEQDLKDIIAEMKPQEAINGYEKLLKDGVSVSLQTRNELLDLVGYYGTVSTTEGVDDVASESSEGESSSSESADESDTSDEEVENARHKRTWSMNNYAEKLFKSMEDRNSRSYDAMILALLKHNYHDRAFELFEDMREQNFQASIFTYNGLINKSYVYYGYGEKLWTAVMNLIEHMKQEPAVSPDLNTYNEILKLCTLIPNGSDKALEVFRDMCSKGIESSLATFSRLLRAEYYRDRSMLLYENENEGELKHKQSTNNSLLQAVISHLESYNKLPGLKHSSDVKFFNTAMGSALFCQDANAAHRLYGLAETNDKTLLGQKRGLFYATFLVTLAQSEKSAEIVYHMYKELVPAVMCLSGIFLEAIEEIQQPFLHAIGKNLKLIPQSWVYSEIFRMVEREKMPRLVPKLYQDMKRYRVPINLQTCRGIFSALARRTSPKNHKQYIEIMTDVFFWMKKFNIPISPYMIGQLVRQYCAGGHLKQAWKAMEMFDEHNFHPTYVALMQLLDCCSMSRDRDQAMKVFEILSKYGYVVSKRKQSSIFDNTQMPLSHRLYINSLFENAEELDRRRAQYNRPKVQDMSENEEIENSM